MTDSNTHGPGARSLEGRVFRPRNAEELAEAIEFAFDYRGDVTIELTSGAVVEGYLFNRNADVPEPVFQVFPKGESSPRIITYAEVASIAFTGTDTASGKSWEAWIAKKESQRRAETEQAAAEARARGHI